MKIYNIKVVNANNEKETVAIYHNVIDWDNQRIIFANGTVTDYYGGAFEKIVVTDEYESVKLYKGFENKTDAYRWIQSTKNRRYATDDEINIYRQYIDKDKKFKVVAIDENYKKPKVTKSSNNDVKRILKDLVKIIEKDV